jgi:uncharacterized protein YegL
MTGTEITLRPEIEVALSTNGAQRSPCVLVLDTSSSMGGHGRIEKLNDALQAFERALKSDETLCQQVVITVITFGGGVQIVSEWTQADAFVAPVLEANGDTPMGEAVRMAHVAIKKLQGEMKHKGIPSTRPWVFLISDGGPNDAGGWTEAADESRRECERSGGPVLWPLAVPPDADASALKRFAASTMHVYSLGNDVNFRALFEKWLIQSLVRLSQSRPNEPVQIAAPTELIIPA